MSGDVLHVSADPQTRPVRIQLRRTKGWRKPTGAVVVARPSILGNPFRVIDTSSKAYPGERWRVEYHPDPRIDSNPEIDVVALCSDRATATSEAVDLYRHWATVGANHYRRVLTFLEGDWVRGHDLACWCPLDQPCHADVLLELANP